MANKRKKGGGYIFQSTPSVWRETSSSCATGNQKDISIHSLRVEGDSVTIPASVTTLISIHSLRVEGDYRPCFQVPM